MTSQNAIALPLHKVPQNLVKNSAVAVVLDFHRGVDAAGGDEVDFVAVSLAGGDFHSLTRLQGVIESDLEGLGAVEVERLAAFAFPVLEWQDAHADQVRAVDTLEALGDDAADAEQVSPLGRPVA